MYRHASISTSSPNSFATDPVPCIIDTDPGVDDVVAILLALASPELLVLAITLTHGNTTLDSTLVNLQKMFYALEIHLQQYPDEKFKWPGLDTQLRQRLGVGPIQVILGPNAPIRGEAVTAKYFHGVDGLSDISTRHPELTPASFPTTHPFYTVSQGNMVDDVFALLNSREPSSIAFLALGPLSSLALLHKRSVQQDKPSTASILHSFAVIFVMGGAVDAPGNTTPVSEFNIYADPYAADVIFSLALPHLHIIPLDTTTSHTLPYDLYGSLVDPSFDSTLNPSLPENKTPLVHFTSSFLEKTRETSRYYGEDAMVLHDPCVIWALIDWSQGEPGGFEDDETAELIHPIVESLVVSIPGDSPISQSATTPISPDSDLITPDSIVPKHTHRRRQTSSDLRARYERFMIEHVLDSTKHGLKREQSRDSVSDAFSEYDDDKLLVRMSSIGTNLSGGASIQSWDVEDRIAIGWEWVWREFAVETSGTMTRGMMVTDRRRVPSGNKNRAIEDDSVKEEVTTPSGAKVIIGTPGADTMRALLMERVWGVTLGGWGM